VPQGDEVVEALELRGPLGLERLRKPLPTSADVMPPDDDAPQWLVRHDALHELLGTRHAVAAQTLVAQELTRRRPALSKRVEFDSEASLFAAYCPTRRDALELRDLIDELISAGAAAPR
jgi:hypothetical protein